MIKAAAIWSRPWDGLPTMGGSLSLDSGRIQSVESVGGGGDLVLVPGLINAHDHARGLSPLAFGAADAPLEAWLWDLRRAPAVDPYLTHAVAFGRMALSGVTSVIVNFLPQSADFLTEAKAAAQAARDVGLRLALVVPIVDQNLSGYDGGKVAMSALTNAEQNALTGADKVPPVAEQIALVLDIANAINDATTITQIGPPGPQWLSEKGWAEVGAASGHGLRLHTHLLETRMQRDWLDAVSPAGAAAFFERAGVLNDRLTVAHGVWLRPDELSALAGAGATLALNTSSNMRLASGLVDGVRLRDAGIALGVGLDGLALDDDADMWRELRLAMALLGPKGMSDDGLPQVGLLRAAFSTGRRIYDGRDAQGLVAGADADFVALSLDRIAADRIDDSAQALATMILGRASQQAVHSVFVAGREIVHAGRLTGLDLAAASKELTRSARSGFAAHPPADWIARSRDAVRAHWWGRC